MSKAARLLDHFVARLVPVGVVHQLEAVEVAHQQGAGRLLLLVGGDEHGVHAIELGAVGDLGQRVAAGLVGQALAALLQRDLRRGVVQQEDRALGIAVAADHRNDVAVDRRRAAVASPDREPPQRLHAGTDRRQDGTIGLAYGAVLLIGELEDVRVPALLADARAGDARQPFGPVVPLHDVAPRS